MATPLADEAKREPLHEDCSNNGKIFKYAVEWWKSRWPMDRGTQSGYSNVLSKKKIKSEMKNWGQSHCHHIENNIIKTYSEIKLSHTHAHKKTIFTSSFSNLDFFSHFTLLPFSAPFHSIRKFINYTAALFAFCCCCWCWQRSQSFRMLNIACATQRHSIAPRTARRWMGIPLSIFSFNTVQQQHCANK